MALVKNQVSDMLKMVTNNNRNWWSDFEKTLSESTAKVYQSDILNYMVYINKDIIDTTSEQFERFIKYNQENGVSNKTINKKYAAIKGLLKHLVNNNVITVNPLDQVKRLPELEIVRQKHELSWQDIETLKGMDGNIFTVFNAVYYEDLTIKQIEKKYGLSNSKVQYVFESLRNNYKMQITFQDLSDARAKFFAKCPECGESKEMTQDNWKFNNGRLVCKSCN